MHLSTLIATSRPAFLVLTFACLSVPFAFAYHEQQTINPFLASLIAIGALCAHIAVNMLNEYLDFKSALDTKTDKTPFSGGSGGLIAQPHAKQSVLVGAIIALIVCCIIGVYISLIVGLPLLVIGLLGISIVLTYTPILNRFPVLCLLAPGAGFGLLLINGSYFILTQTFNPNVLMVSFIVFFQVNNLLLLNQFPDIEADKAHGRRHWAIHYGRASAARIYTGMALFSAGTLAISLGLGYISLLNLIVFIPIGLSLHIGWFLIRMASHASNQELLPNLRNNVLVTLLTPCLIALGVL
jgi:1,4-dihydroxy-2-naphthoate octaprenyltransferase